MDTRTQYTLASALTLAAGLWLLVTPLFISMTGAALVTILVVGAIIALAGLAELFWKNTMPSWVSALAAIWLFASALLITMSDAAAWNMIVTAVATFALALWDGAEVSRLQGRPTVQT